MTSAGFARHSGEWWHFSLGDQMWALHQRQQNIDPDAIARYGRDET
jgi:D-alanyl-D-alanine dipeptidase